MTSHAVTWRERIVPRLSDNREMPASNARAFRNVQVSTSIEPEQTANHLICRYATCVPGSPHRSTGSPRVLAEAMGAQLLLIAAEPGCAVAD